MSITCHCVHVQNLGVTTDTRPSPILLPIPCVIDFVIPENAIAVIMGGERRPEIEDSHQEVGLSLTDQACSCRNAIALHYSPHAFAGYLMGVVCSRWQSING